MIESEGALVLIASVESVESIGSIGSVESGAGSGAGSDASTSSSRGAAGSVPPLNSRTPPDRPWSKEALQERLYGA